VANYPPKLLRLLETDFGSVLLLEDDTQVSIDVRPARLDEALSANGLPTLSELIASHSLGVFVGLFRMTATQWSRISACVRSSTEAAAVFLQFPSLWSGFGESHEIIAAKVHRLYGGLSQFLYTSHPFDFRDDPNRPLPWFRALLNDRDGWLFNTWVNLETAKVEIEAEQHPGHFVE
jgi:hypothetical protein